MASSKEIAENSLFGKMVTGKISCEKVYEDDYCIVIKDISPVAPVHLLILPKHAVYSVSCLSNDSEQDKTAMGYIMTIIPRIASILQIKSYRLVINEGEQAQQNIGYLCIHLIGGRELAWPPA
ncbi:hypothetical protein CYY_008994 [Polysphondylium violaceum]|uniref:HIT domain-containing protein n=1 Tax=Polysphondylium violaceum TaxID=133409 RepID=A0A8J4PUC0_9MYCE|nr:hypothetical protein CYY_008994 [Polysphondylium violaceum]